LCFWFALFFGFCLVVVVGVGRAFSTWLLAEKHWLLGISYVAYYGLRSLDSGCLLFFLYGKKGNQIISHRIINK
jgi:hypothetical protein